MHVHGDGQRSEDQERKDRTEGNPYHHVGQTKRAEYKGNNKKETSIQREKKDKKKGEWDHKRAQGLHTYLLNLSISTAPALTYQG